MNIKKEVKYKEIYDLIKIKNLRKDFVDDYQNRFIKPDGGILYLKKQANEHYLKVLLVAEVKKQGTNEARIKEGKPKQAQGNAIERLGKNLIGIRTMMNYEKITPFVCFGWGCDFDQDQKTVLAKIITMNQFYRLNKIYVFKKDGGCSNNFYAPVSMYFRKEEWNKEEMIKIMKEIAETAFRYYVH